jgi:DNA repair protein RadC
MYNQFFQVPDGELLSMVAGRAVAVRNANAAELITAIDSGAIKGAAARKIAAVLELSRRLVAVRLADNNRVTDSAKTFAMVKDMALLDVEHFDVIFLRNNNTVIARENLFVGGTNQTTVDAGVVYRRALVLGAKAIIAVHNHPSGSLTPSTNDKQLTRQLVEAGRLVDVRMIEHLIVAGNGVNDYFSFLDNGML